MDISQKKKKKKRKKTIQNTQDTVHKLKRLNKVKCPSEDTSVPLGREKKAITNGEGGRSLGGKMDTWEGGEAMGDRGEPDLLLGEGKGLKP